MKGLLPVKSGRKGSVMAVRYKVPRKCAQVAGSTVREPSVGDLESRMLTERGVSATSTQLPLPSTSL
jgi:hypothetical protein